MRIIRVFLLGCLICLSLVSYADYYSMAPAQVADLSPESAAVTEYNWRADVANVHAPGGIAALPVPEITKHKTDVLSLKEAILLSLRNNPNVQSQELTRITDKYALILAHNGFEPQYTLGGTGRLAKGNRPVYSSNAGVSLKTSLGTNISMTYSNTYLGGGGPGQTAVTITQPLLKGFGRELNLIPWRNAIDTENQARLSFKNQIMTQVVAVITAYRQLIEDFQNLAIQKRTLKRNLETVKQSKLKLKVGQLAESDLLQQQATYETTKLSLLSQQSSYLSDYQNFLQTLGLKANAKVNIIHQIDLHIVQVPSLQECIQLALKGNIDYQNALIAIRAIQRSVLTAENANRWQLDLAGSFNIYGNTNAPTFVTNNGVTQVLAQNNTNLGSPNLTLTLNIPINDVAAQQGIINAKVQLQQAKLGIEALKLQLTRQITNEWQQIQNQRLTVKSSERQVLFQQKSLEAAQIKYKYGRTTTFEVNQISDQLLSQETSLVQNRISLLNLITTLNKDLGITLEKWGIELRY